MSATAVPGRAGLPSDELVLHVDLLHSMALVGFGILLGYGTALLVVFLNGRG